MDKETITAICTGIALLIGALISPLINLIKDLISRRNADIEQVSEDEKYVTKCELEVKHREIMEEVGRKFASNDTVTAMQSEFKEIKGKLDDIIKMLLERK